MKPIPILTNFNVPVDIRSKFDDVCRLSGRTRTQVLVELMSDYVLTKGPAIAEKIQAIRQLDLSLQNARPQARQADRDTSPVSIWITDGRYDADAY